MIQDHFEFSCVLFVTFLIKNTEWFIFNNSWNSVLYNFFTFIGDN
jgi:hypothetical protein